MASVNGAARHTHTDAVRSEGRPEMATGKWRASFEVLAEVVILVSFVMLNFFVYNISMYKFYSSLCVSDHNLDGVFEHCP